MGTSSRRRLQLARGVLILSACSAPQSSSDGGARIDGGPSDAAPSDSGVSPYDCASELYALSHLRAQVKATDTTCWMVSDGDSVLHGACLDNQRTRFQAVLDVETCTVKLRQEAEPTRCVAAPRVGSPLRLVDCSAGGTAWAMSRKDSGVYRLAANNVCVAAEGTALMGRQCGSAESTTILGLEDERLWPALTARAPGAAIEIGANSVLFNFGRGVSPVSYGQVAEYLGGFLFERPGAHVQFDLNVADAGPFLVSLTGASWLRGATVAVVLDGSLAAHVELTPDDARGVMRDASATLLQIPPGTHVLRLESAQPVQFGIPVLHVTGIGQPLPAFAATTPLDSEGTTELPLFAISDVYRFTVITAADGRRVWAHPHNRAFIDYDLEVPRAGTYELEVEYSSTTPTEGLLVSHDIETNRALEPAEVLASIDLPMGATAAAFLTSAPAPLQLPAGRISLRIGARTPPDGGVGDISIAAVRIRPL
jgi:hypothetical protein